MTANSYTSSLLRLVIVICLITVTYVIIMSFYVKRYDTFLNTRTIDIVVARYAEPLTWLCSNFFKDLCESKNNAGFVINLHIYNKGASFKFPNCIPKNVNVYMHQLKNVGRCDHTYLYHICTNYKNLADVTIFLPGSCDMDSKAERTVNVLEYAFTHMNTAMICHNVGDVKNALYDFKLDGWLSSNQANAINNQDPSMQLSPIRPFGKWFEYVFGADKVTRCVNWFGILAVSKADILHRRQEFYEQLMAMLDNHNNPEVGHYIERSWYAIFDA